MKPFDLSSEYALSESQIDAFKTNGHIFLTGLASQPEISFYRQAILEGVKKLNTEKRKLEERDTYGKAFLQIYNLWRQNEILKTFVLSRRFAHVADGPRLPPGAVGHSDLARLEACSLAIARVYDRLQ